MAYGELALARQARGQLEQLATHRLAAHGEKKDLTARIKELSEASDGN